MKLEPDSYLLKIDREKLRALGWNETTDLQVIVKDNLLVIAPEDVEVTFHTHMEKSEAADSPPVGENGRDETETQKAINLILSKFRGRKFTTEEAAGVLSMERTDAAKIISYAKSKKLIRSEEHPEDKRLRIYSVVQRQA